MIFFPVSLFSISSQAYSLLFLKPLWNLPLNSYHTASVLITVSLSPQLTLFSFHCFLRSYHFHISKRVPSSFENFQEVLCSYCNKFKLLSPVFIIIHVSTKPSVLNLRFLVSFCFCSMLKHNSSVNSFTLHSPSEAIWIDRQEDLARGSTLLMEPRVKLTPVSISLVKIE